MRFAYEPSLFILTVDLRANGPGIYLAQSNMHKVLNIQRPDPFGQTPCLRASLRHLGNHSRWHQVTKGEDWLHAVSDERMRCAYGSSLFLLTRGFADQRSSIYLAQSKLQRYLNIPEACPSWSNSVPSCLCENLGMGSQRHKGTEGEDWLHADRDERMRCANGRLFNCRSFTGQRSRHLRPVQRRIS